MKLERRTNIKWNSKNLSLFSKIVFQRVRLVKNVPQNAKNKRFWAIFCKKLWNSNASLEDTVFWILLYQNILKQSRTAVSGKFLYTALLTIMQSTYTKTLFHFAAPENFGLFYGGFTKNSEWYMFIWQYKLETCSNWRKFRKRSTLVLCRNLNKIGCLIGWYLVSL